MVTVNMVEAVVVVLYQEQEVKEGNSITVEKLGTL